MVVKIDEWESSEKPMNRGTISSQFHQYLREGVGSPVSLHHHDECIDTE